MSYVAFLSAAIRPHRRRLVLAVVMLGMMTLLSLVPPLVLAFVVDIVVAKSRYDLLAPVMIAALLVPFVDGLFRVIGQQTVMLLGQRVIFDIRIRLYDSVQHLSCRFLQNTTTGKLMERLRGDVLQLQSLLTNQTLNLVMQLITAMLALSLMLFISARLTAVVGLAVVLYVLNYHWFVRRIQVVQRRYRRRMDLLSGQAQERLAATLLVKTFNNQRLESRRFARNNFLAERVFHRFRILNVTYGLTSSFIAWGSYVLVLLGGTWMVIRGTMTYGAVTAMGAYTWRLLTPAVQLSQLSNQFQLAKVSLDRIFELMRSEPDPVVFKGKPVEQLLGEVELQDVHFEYEPDKPVLRGVDLHVKPGQTVALVGHTGCGKSTIISLLYRYYDICSGRILIDGQDLRELDTQSYRRHLAMVPQEPIVFDTTIAENIAYGRPKATEQQIEQAARAAELGPVLDRLPDGIHTLLGDFGAKLSRGECQRLCIARAILADPAILILDEATSSLDTQSEMMIQAVLRRVMRNRTCFVVAHRLSTIVRADQIVVMDAGRIVELGRHSDLMKIPDGRYRHLFLTQNQSATTAAAKGKVKIA